VARSAGTAPAGYVHPMAIQVMAELGIDISTHRSKAVSEFRDADFDLAIAVCDHGAKTCPLRLGPSQVVHMGFPDPAQSTGTEGERLPIFRQVRDDIRHKVFCYLDRVAD
ncbi:unnamed protein product, partial [marine sediment metagenome]